MLGLNKPEIWETKINEVLRAYASSSEAALKRKVVDISRYWRGVFGKHFPAQCLGKSKDKIYGKVKAESNDVLIYVDCLGLSFLHPVTQVPLFHLTYFEIEKIEPYGAKDQFDVQLEGVVYSFKSARAMDIKMFVTTVIEKLTKVSKTVMAQVDGVPEGREALRFQKGDLIELTEKISDSMWRGRLKTQTGTFSPGLVETVVLKPVFVSCPHSLWQTIKHATTTINKKNPSKNIQIIKI